MARRAGAGIDLPARARPAGIGEKSVARHAISKMESCTQMHASAQCVRAQTHMRTRINKLHARISWAHQARLPNMRGVGRRAALSRAREGSDGGQVCLARRSLGTAKASRFGARERESGGTGISFEEPNPTGSRPSDLIGLWRMTTQETPPPRTHKEGGTGILFEEPNPTGSRPSDLIRWHGIFI